MIQHSDWQDDASQRTTPVEDKFPAWGKTPRLINPEMIITEKIDGTNALIAIGDDGTLRPGSRTKWLTPEADNFGFAKWCAANKEELLQLGPGRHYGEWWGAGIQRRYGLAEKRFSLFNADWPEAIPSCVARVPVLYRGLVDLTQIDLALSRLLLTGSHAAPGFPSPEGVIIWVMGDRYKRTFEAKEAAWALP